MGAAVGTAALRLGCGCAALFLALVLLSSTRAAGGTELALPDELGLRIAPDFHITLYADSSLANDVRAMTLDAQGRVVVTGPGYIKTLHDSDDDGRADQVTLFATTASGGMGLCFDGNNLYFVGDGALSVYRDTDGDGKADGPPEKLLSAAFSEHGGHAMRKGPDGWWYFIGGNDSGFTSQHITLPSSPVPEPEAGALLRLSPDGKKSEVIAHGLRNPYDFDFNSLGDIFACDSGVESDLLLPWYAPTRLYHVGYGGHHGWRLTGGTRSWNRPDYYVDTVEILQAVGRGSATGVACYRHSQFPQHYRDGLFVLDWTFGKVYYFPLRPDGSSYHTEGEVFLEPIGTNGFAPTDLAVAPDGSLFIAIGGRKTRGAVYRIRYGDDRPTPKTRVPSRRADEDEKNSDPNAWQKVLQAPQPLDAWSRTRWMPVAQKLGAQPFRFAVVNDRLPPAERIRAVEVLTELFGGLETARALVAAKARSPQIRARVAWSVGRVPCENLEMVLAPLANDSHLAVRRSALEALADRVNQVEAAEIVKVLPANLGYPDKRVRQAAARLASLLPKDAWKNLWERLERAGTQARLTGIMALIWRREASANQPEALEKISNLLLKTTDSKWRLQAVRLLMLALGDYRLQNPSAEVYAGYQLLRPISPDNAVSLPVRRNLRDSFPSGDDDLDREAARLLAMLDESSPAGLEALADLCTSESPPASDFHYLAVLSCLSGERSGALTRKIAQAVLSLDQKLAGRESRNRKNWNLCLVEVVANLIRHDPQLTEELLSHPGFATPGQVVLATALGPEARLRATARFKSAAEQGSHFAWSGELVDLLANLPANEVHPLFREQWTNSSLRDPLLAHLARKPDSLDRGKYLQGLESGGPEIQQVCLSALAQLPRDPRPEHLVPLLRALQRLFSDPAPKATRSQILALINRQADVALKVRESGTDWASLRRAYQPVFTWFGQRHPKWADTLEDGKEGTPAK